MPAEISCFHDYGQELVLKIKRKKSLKVINAKKYELNS